MNIIEIKSAEFQEVVDFVQHLYDFGHIFHLDPKKLDEPFDKILRGIEDIRIMMDESYGM